MNRIHIRNYFHGGGGWNAGYLKGTLYVSSIPIETSVFEQWNDRLSTLMSAYSKLSSVQPQLISSQSSSSFHLMDSQSIDYIFLDPPFGSNINYSELNFIWESWLKVTTNNKPEAIENEVQQKGAVEYRKLMTDCFREAYRILKPGRWMTVEFSNTSAAVWNSIQKALSDAGFIVANVAALDKQQGSFKAVTTPTAVKQDLIISAYKPNDGFEERFIQEAGTETGVWDFVRTHLKYLSVAKVRDGKLVTVSERDPRLLFDQLVAYYFRKGLNVPISSQDFQEGLARRFDERDGMYFLPEQSPEYDRRKATAGAPEQGELFVSDEVSAIAWLRQLLKVRTLTFQEINPLFMQETSNWKKYESVLELQELLEQNFLCYNGITDVPSQIHTYLSSNWHEYRELPKNDPKLQAKAANRWFVPDPNKAGDLEKLREKNLLCEFEDYRKETKKLKTFRLEAVRAGFKKAYQERDYQTIISVGSKIPDAIIEEDPKLLMWFEMAQMLAGK